MDYKKIIKDLEDFLRKNLEESGAKGFVFGLSGGIDSAVIAALAKRVTDNVLGLIMPCLSNPKDEEDARQIAKAIDLEVKKIDLSNTYKELINVSFDNDNSAAKSNIKPRLRMTTLYYYAHDLNYLVLGPSNASEFYVGYSTKHGDSAADLFPIGNILKRDVFGLAKELGLPNLVIDKKPSAGLLEGQTDEDDMGFTYEILDSYIAGEKTPESDIKEKIDRMHRNSEHKRKLAPKFEFKY